MSSTVEVSLTTPVDGNMDSKGTPREGKEKKNIRLQQNKEKM
jgi:hypothetical protein